jgi:thioesterase domain-containing protein
MPISFGWNEAHVGQHVLLIDGEHVATVQQINDPISHAPWMAEIGSARMSERFPSMEKARKAVERLLRIEALAMDSASLDFQRSLARVQQQLDKSRQLSSEVEDLTVTSRRAARRPQKNSFNES